MKKFRIGLLPRIIIAIILGVALGHFLPVGIIRVFTTFNSIFGEFLGFCIPLIIIGLVTIAIADIGKNAGRMLVITALIAYVATLFSGFMAYFVGATSFPYLITQQSSIEAVEDAKNALPFFSISIPPIMNVMTALISSFVFGLCIAKLNANTLREGFREFQNIIIMVIIK